MTDWSKAEWVDPARGWQPLPIDDMPERILLDLATRCNLRCPMCVVWGSGDEAEIDKVRGAMDLEKARRLLDEIMGHRPLVQPNMWGEPLLAPEFKARIADMKARGLTVAMNTNGLTLNEDIARYLVETKMDSVFFSIDSVTKETLKAMRGVDKLEKIEAAVFRMLKARGSAEVPRIGVSFTETDKNRHEMQAFVDRWVGVVDCVRVGIVFEDGRFPAMQEPKVRTACPALYKTMSVHNDGTVSYCCLDGFKATNVGNVFETSAREVWHGEALAKVRYFHETAQWDQVPFCKGCNGWAQYDFEEEVRDGILIRRSPQFAYYNRIDRLSNWHGKLLGGHPAINLDAAAESAEAAD